MFPVGWQNGREIAPPWLIVTPQPWLTSAPTWAVPAVLAQFQQFCGGNSRSPACPAVQTQLRVEVPVSLPLLHPRLGSEKQSSSSAQFCAVPAVPAVPAQFQQFCAVLRSSAQFELHQTWLPSANSARVFGGVFWSLYLSQQFQLSHVIPTRKCTDYPV